jgi:hypothetical protein
VPRCDAVVDFAELAADERAGLLDDLKAVGWDAARSPEAEVSHLVGDFDNTESLVAGLNAINQAEGELLFIRSGEPATLGIRESLAGAQPAKLIADDQIVKLVTDDQFVKIFAGESQPSRASEAGTAGQDRKKAAEDKAKSGPETADKANVVREGLSAIATDPSLWKYVELSDRRELAKSVLTALYAARQSYAERVEWVLAPELPLLSLSPKEHQKALAQRILERREQISTEDRQLLEQDVERKKVGIEGQRKVLAVLDEFLEHARKWRQLANWGIGLLLACVGLAIAMTIYLIVFKSDVNQWALPAIIFALALFAVSPAVLLLLERPLKGVDEWKPGGGDSTSSTNEVASDDATAESTGTLKVDAGTKTAT